MKSLPTFFLAVFTSLSLASFAYGNSGSSGDDGNINATVKNSNCTNQGKSANSTVTESNGGTVEPTDGGSTLPSGSGVTRSTAGQGTGALTEGTPMVLPITPGKEYTVSWSGDETASAHTLVEPHNLPEGYSLEVNDGTGWTKGKSIDHVAPQGQFLDLPAQTTKFRITRPATPAGKNYPIQLTRPFFKYAPSSIGVERVPVGSYLYDLETPKMHTMISLGAVSESGRSVSAGYLILDKELWVDSQTTFKVNTSMVSYEGTGSADVDVIKLGANNRIRQVLAPELIIDIVTLGTNSFEVRLYPPGAKGSENPDGTYNLSGSAIGKCLIEKVGGGNGYSYGVRARQYDGAVLTGDVELKAEKTSFGPHFDTRRAEGTEVETVSSQPYSLGIGSGYVNVVIAGQSVQFANTTVYRDETVELKRDGKLVAHRVSRILFTDAGEATLDQVDKYGTDTDEILTTQFHYNYNNSIKPLFKYNPDGSWEKYEYNDQGYVTNILRPWKGQPATPWSATSSNCQSEDISYAEDPYNPIPANAPAGVNVAMANLVASRTLSILGLTVQRTNYTYIAETINSEPVLKTTTTEFSNALESQTSISRSYHSSASMAARGMLLEETAPGNQQTSYAYEAGTWDAANKVFSPLAGGLTVRQTVTHGTTASPAGITNQTKRIINIRNAAMKLLRQETQIYTGGSNYETATFTDYTYDSAGRLTSTDKDLRNIETRIYSGLVTTITDETGIVRVVTKDANGRITSDAKAGGPTATTVYDGTKATTTPGTLSSIKEVDLLGREKKTTSVDGSKITTTYPSKGKNKKVKYPGGPEVLFTRFPGGLEEKTTNASETPIVPRHYTHGVNADGTQWKTTKFATSGSSRWLKVTKDWLGRIINEESPAPSGSGTVIKTILYNADGLKEKVSYSANAGLADRIYEYDILGNLYRVGVDMDSGGLTTASTDTLTEYTFNFHKEGAVWYQQRLLKEYQTDSSSTATTVETTRVRLNGNINSTIGHVVNINAAGVTTEVIETINVSNKTRTLTTTRSDRTGSATQKWINGLLKEEQNSWDTTASTYGYDALDRLETTTNPRNGSVVTRAYNAQNQLASITDHQNNVTSYFYYPSTHDNAGQLKEIRNAQNKSVYYEYNDRGENTLTWGAATTPSKKSYNSYGQLKTLETYRAGSGWTTDTWPSSGKGTADKTTWVYFGTTGLLKEKKDASNNKTKYTWKNNGQLHTREWERGTLTTLGYNAAGQETSRVYSNEPSGITTPDVTTTRDRSGRVQTITDGSGTRTLSYTPSHQLDTASYGASGILADYLLDYGFDAMGRQNGFTVKHNTTSLYENAWGYEPVSGRLETIESGTHKAKYHRYKNSSLIQQITWEHNGQPVMHNTRAYDSLSRLSATTNYIQAPGGVQPVAHHGYEYDQLHRRTKTTLLDGSYWSYGYTDRGELDAADKHLSSGTMLAGQQFHFGFDNAGNRTSKEVGGDSSGSNRRSFTTPSNELNQYDSFDTPGFFNVIGKAPAGSTVTVNTSSANVTRQGDYFHGELTASNTNGAWLTVSVADGGSPITGHRYIPPTNFTPTYDDDGNLTSDGEWDYTYDAENRLIKAQRTAAAQAAGAPYRRMEYAYDSAHRRIQAIHFHGSTSPPAKTEKYLYDNRNRCLTVNATNAPQQSYTWGLDALGTLDSAGGGAGGVLWITDHPTTETHLACTDGNANIVNLVSSSTKAVTATYEYTPFGELLRITGTYAHQNPYRFSTKPQDQETGNYDYGFRSYKPSWGTWLGRDPLGELGGNNLYGFIGNDPINDVDHNGLLSLATHLRLLGETLTERDTYNQIGDNFNSLGRGLKNGAAGAVDGIKSLPEIADFVSSGEAAEMIDRLANDEDFRKEFAKQMGDSVCDFLDKISSNDGAFEAAGEQFFDLATGALKAIKVFRKLQKIIPERRKGIDAPRELVNVDTGSAAAFVSQNSPVRHSLKADLKGRQMVMSETAVSEFERVLGAAGPKEAARARRFLDRVQVVPDNPSARAMGLTTTRKVGVNDKIIFGTGDNLGAPTMTSDAKFLRGASAQGVDFNALVHKPVPLTGQ